MAHLATITHACGANDMNNLHSLIEARQEAFAENCLGEIGWLWDEPQDRLPAIQAFNRETIRLILEAQCALLEGRKKMTWRDKEEHFYADGFNSAITEIITSNRELLKTLQS